MIIAARRSTPKIIPAIAAERPRSPEVGRQMRRDIGHRSSSGAAMMRISRS
jgi:hypothetical protein